MNLRNLIPLFAISLFSILLSSCSQEEGLGGNCSVKGTVVEQFYNDDYSLLIYEETAKDEDIFLIFGDDQVIGENTNTNYNGNFEFEYLWPGNYKLYYYSDNILSPEKGELEAITEFTLEKNQALDLGELIKVNSLDFDDGAATIKGTVLVINYLNSSVWPALVIKDISKAQELEIYLTYGDHPFYDERIRTQYDGTFVFPNLIKGQYRVFLYSEDITGGTEDIVISKDVEIDTENKVIDLGDIYIERL